MKPFVKKGRNVTCDNYFTSLDLAEIWDHKEIVCCVQLIEQEDKFRLPPIQFILSYLVLREIPKEIKTHKAPLYDTKVLKANDITLTVYQVKAKKNVLIPSSLHQSVEIGHDTKKKPGTVKCYNDTKYGVDVVDQMARKYSVKSSSRRWPLHTFSNVLDLAGINAWVLYKKVTNTKITLRNFLLQLSKELTDRSIKKSNQTIENK